MYVYIIFFLLTIIRNLNVIECNNDIKIKRMNFTEISLRDKKCLEFYNKYVEPTQNIKNEDKKKLSHVTFDEYLEYWWNSEETDKELIKRVCDLIYHRYSKSHIRKAYF
jgi:hypothetical protein